MEDVLTKEMLESDLERIYQMRYEPLSLLEWDRLLRPGVLHIWRMILVDCLKQLIERRQIDYE